MKLFALLALTGTVAAFRISRDHSSNEQELQYKFTSEVFTGIPELNSQYSGFRLGGQYTVQSQTDGSVKIQLRELKYVTVNDQVHPDTLHHKHDIPADVKQHLEAPFKVVYTPSGQVKEIYTESTEPEILTNIKKSLVNVNFDWLKGSRMIDTNQIHRNVDSDTEPKSYFKVMEKNIEGECEVEYSVNMMPEYQVTAFEQQEGGSSYCQDKTYYEVVKSVNYQNCKTRPIYQRSVGSDSKSDGSAGTSSPYLTESSVTRSVWCGSLKSPVLRKQHSEQKVVVSANGKFESQEKIEMTSKVTSSLQSCSTKTSHIPELSSPKKSKDLIFSFPTGDFWSSSRSGRSEQEQQFLPQPSDMTTTPLNLFPSLTEEEAKQRFVKVFVSMLEVSKQSPESSHKHLDVATQSTYLTHLSKMLSYENVIDCWNNVKQELSQDITLQKKGLNFFCDILAMTPTNPSVKFIAEKIKSKEIEGESGAWIAANMIRSVRTPTEETIQELVNLLKHSTVQQNRNLWATVAMTLTEMVYKACVDETSSRYNYPTQIYGRFCSKNSKVVRKDLIPYLKQSLADLRSDLKKPEPDTSSMSKLITLINCLGNLGMEEASQSLLEIVDGRYSHHSQPRTCAVYKLSRSAQNNPSKYRPVFLTIIHNNAEAEEVRMAAVATLPYVQPSSAQLQKLAVLTWFDSSKQVTSFIISTLKSIADLPTGSQESLSHLSQKAGEALKLSKPFKSGFQKSQSVRILQFLDTLKASVGLRLQYVNSEESAFPRTMYIKSEIFSKAQTMTPFESAVYLQGVDTVLEELYNMYKSSQPDKPEEKLRFESRPSAKPEAHLSLKMFDMQRLFSVDSEYIKQSISELLKTEIKNPLKSDFMKVLELNHHYTYFPTISGVPLYLHHRTPVVMSAQTTATIGTNNATIEITTKPVFNYLQKTEVGTLFPVSKEYHGATVDNSLHVTLPLTAKLSLNKVININLKTPEDPESQKGEKPIIEFRVRPYTKRLEYEPRGHKKESKTIHSKHSQHHRQYNIGSPLGLDLKLKMETEHQYSDLASILSSLSLHQPLTLLSLPLPLSSCRPHQVSLTYSPALSKTKEVSINLSLGYATKQTLFGQPKISVPAEYEDDKRISEECEQEVKEGKWLLEPRDEDSQDEEEERRYWSHTSQETYRQKLKQRLEKERREHQCRKVKRCEEEESVCNNVWGDNRPWFCSEKAAECNQQEETKMATKSVLYKLGSSSALTFSAAINFKSSHSQQKVEMRATVGQSQARTRVELTGSMDLPSVSSSPYEVTFTSSGQVDQPRSKWNKMSILEQELSGQVHMKLSYGQRSHNKETASTSIKLYQSAEQKKYAQESQCQQGRILTQECKEARRQASSLDTIQANVKLPSSLSQNIFLKTISQLSQAYVAPYIQHLQYNTKPQDRVVPDNQYLCHINIHPQGEKFSVSVQSKESDLEIKDIRVTESLKGLIPFNVKDSGARNILQKLTSRQAPSTCSSEQGVVRTFDNLEYDYQMNDCEHVIFKDCSESSRVEVTVQKKSSSSHLKVTIDNHKYEVEIPRSGSKAVIKVNDEEKSYIKKEDYENRKISYQQIQSLKYQEITHEQSEMEELKQVKKQKSEFIEQKQNYYEDKSTYVTSYEDGVYAVVNDAYGIAVYSDGRSLEVETYQHLLRNKACGLCGDLNDETVADVKSPGSCIMSSPSLAAFTYMLADQSCQGIPAHQQEQIKAETQHCLQKQNIPTQVSQIYHQARPVYRKHLVEEKNNNICISAEQIRVCPSNSNPQEIEEKKVSFYCMSKDSQSLKMQKMAEQGEYIDYDFYKYPTSFQKYISQPKRC